MFCQGAELWQLRAEASIELVVPPEPWPFALCPERAGLFSRSNLWLGQQGPEVIFTITSGVVRMYGEMFASPARDWAPHLSSMSPFTRR